MISNSSSLTVLLDEDGEVCRGLVLVVVATANLGDMAAGDRPQVLEDTFGRATVEQGDNRSWIVEGSSSEEGVAPLGTVGDVVDIVAVVA